MARWRGRLTEHRWAGTRLLRRRRTRPRQTLGILQPSPAARARDRRHEPGTGGTSPGPATAVALEALLADLDGAVADLAEANRRDEVERASALAELEEYDRLVALQRDAEAAQARAERVREEARLKARRLAAIETEVRRALDEGELEGAEALLAGAGVDLAGSEALSALRETVALRTRERRVAAADTALRLARYEYRRCPEEAIACLEAVDHEDVPAELSRQVFGEWAAACARICRRGLCVRDRLPHRYERRR
jgi:hypothetical protein